jgi:hypothetical protein
MTHTHTVVVPLCLLAAGGVWFGLSRTPAAPVHEPAPADAASPGTRPPTPVSAPGPAVAAPVAESPAPQAQAVFPDGSKWPLLNGVTETVTMPWPNRPFSPVVDKVFDQGQDWYRHADGTWTTTVLRPETVSGKMVAVGLVFTPKPAAPARLREPDSPPATRR